MYVIFMQVNYIHGQQLALQFDRQQNSMASTFHMYCFETENC